MTERWDCLVIGVGGFGSAVLDHLARRGVRVLGIEQHDVAHDQGASHGESRIIRTAYFEHPDYVPLLHRAFEGWRDLEADEQTSLLHCCGLFLCGRPSGEAVGGTLRAAREHHLTLERLTPREAAARFPGFRFDEEESIVFEQEAGWLAVEACVAAHIRRALRHGAVLHTGERVVRWTSSGRLARVQTDRGIYEAAKLIITAGPWSGQILRRLQVPLQVLRKVQLWFKVNPGSYRDTPCFLYEQRQGAFYGFPSLDGQTIKAAEHNGGQPVDDPGLVDRRCLPEDVRPVGEFVERSLLSAHTPALRHSVCMYTMSPDGHFIVDKHPELENVVLGAGFSGHGFKFTGVIGQALADLSLEGRTKLPIAFLGFERFQA